MLYLRNESLTQDTTCLLARIPASSSKKSSTFDPRAQQNACRHRDARQQSRSFARWNPLLRRSPNSNRGRMGSVLTFDTKNSLYGRRRLETCVHDPISKRWAIHFKLIVVCERRTLASATFFSFPQPDLLAESLPPDENDCPSSNRHEAASRSSHTPHPRFGENFFDPDRPEKSPHADRPGSSDDK